MNKKQESSTWAYAYLIIAIFSLYTFQQFLAAGRDDTFIMLWAGQSLGESSWFINYNYEKQEVASSITATLIASLTKNLAVENALFVIKICGLVVASLTLLLIWIKRSLIFKNSCHQDKMALGVILATGSSPAFAYWAVGGLETPYYSFFLTAFYIAFISQLTTIKQKNTSFDWSLFSTGCFVTLTRTEGFWIILVALITTPVLYKFSLINLLWKVKALLLSLMALITLCFLRYLFTGSLWPSPVYAKVGNIQDLIPTGWKYVTDYYTSSAWGYVSIAGVLYGTIFLIRALTATYSSDSVKNTRTINILALVSFISGHHMVTILSGGNWMEHYRFMSPIIPMTNILIFMMFGDAFHVAHKYISSCISTIIIKKITFILIFLAALLQTIATKESAVHTCSTPINKHLLLGGIQDLSKSTILNNCAHTRDWYAIKPFIDNELPSLLTKNNNHLTVASFQAGFFPYFIRKKYSPHQIYFIDTRGLTDLHIALIKGEKTNSGNSDGLRIDLALSQKNNSLFPYLSNHSPDLVYERYASPEIRQNFLNIGYSVVWDKPHAVVFYKSSIESLRAKH